MKTIALALASTAFAITGCASAPKPKIIGCEPTPSRFLTNDKGVPSVAVFQCYREDGVMAFASRPATLDELAAMTAKQTKPKVARK